MEGKIYSLSIENLDLSEMDRGYNQFMDYYYSLIDEYGWEQLPKMLPNNNEQIFVQGPFTDEMDNIFSSVIKIKDNKLFILAITNYIASTTKAGDLINNALDYNCPCTSNFMVFINNPIDINQISIDNN